MHISQIRYGRNFQISEFLYEKYEVEITINGSDNVDDAFIEAERIIREQHYLKNKDNSFYAKPKSDEDLPINQVQEPSLSEPYSISEDGLIAEMQSFKLKANIFIAVYSNVVKGNTKLEEAYNKKLAELSK
jgi:hypothetical protein